MSSITLTLNIFTASFLVVLITIAVLLAYTTRRRLVHALDLKAFMATLETCITGSVNVVDALTVATAAPASRKFRTVSNSMLADVLAGATLDDAILKHRNVLGFHNTTLVALSCDNTFKRDTLMGAAVANSERSLQVETRCADPVLAVIGAVLLAVPTLAVCFTILATPV